LAVLAALPCVYWTQGVETRAAVEAAGLRRLCVAPEQAGPWAAAGFTVSAVPATALASRETLPAPGVAARAGIASPTRSPWVVAHGWRFMRQPARTFVYDAPAGKGALAAAEAFAYGADALLKIDAADLNAVGEMLQFLDALPAANLPPLADLAVVDDGSAVTGEVMNLLARRNLLYQVVQAPSSRFRINVAVGGAGYPIEEAADPSAFALKIRRQLTDEQRALRVYGSEVVIGRLTGDETRIRLHLLNYGGREIEGLRIRLRGAYRDGEAYAPGAPRQPLKDVTVSEGATELSLGRLATYAVIDLRVAR
jgi:hypothetical protein